MRIAFVVHTFFPNWQAGTEIYTRSLARAAKESGHEVFITSYEPPSEGDAFDEIRAWDTLYEELPVHRISFLKRHRLFHRKDYFHPEVEEHLLRYFSEIQPDIVHVVHAMHLSTASIWAAKRLNLPVVSTATDFWYACPTYQLVKWNESLCSGPAPLMCIACLNAEPSGHWIRRLGEHDRLARLISPLLTFFASVPFKPVDWVASLIWLSKRESWMRRTMSEVDVLMIPTPNTGRVLLGNGLRPRSVRNSSFGLDTSAFRTTPREPSAVLRVGYVGTFRHSKGLHILLESIRSLPGNRVHLDVYGKPGHFPEYDERIAKLAAGLNNVEFRGTFPNEKLSEVYAGFDALVIPALWHENSPLVLLSAFALKTPVIASRVGSLADLVQHEKNGLLFQMANPRDLTAQIQRLLDDPMLLERLRAGIPTVKTVGENVEELLGIYDEVVGEYTNAERHHRPVSATPPSTPRVPLWWGALFRSVQLLVSGVQFGDSLALLRCHVDSGSDREVSFDFRWHAAALVPDWMVFIHFVDEHGVTTAQGDHWLGNREPDPWGYIRYQFRVWLSKEHSGKSFAVRLGVWNPKSQARLSVTRARRFKIDQAERAIRLGPVRIGPSTI